MARENSTNNSLSSPKRTTNDQSPEESGWTLYFEDLVTESTHFSSESDHQTFSVTDAASSIAINKLNERAAATSGFCSKDMRSFNNNLSFKRRKMMELLLEDDSLQDTASSPVNSPKVSDSTYFSKNMKQNENLAIPQVDESSEMGFAGIRSDCTELKKKGLCLVPLTMVVNYLAK